MDGKARTDSREPRRDGKEVERAIECRQVEVESKNDPSTTPDSPPVPLSSFAPGHSRRVEEAVRVHLNPGREAAADWTQSMPGMHAVDGCIWLSDQSTSSKIDHSDFAGTSVPSLPTPPHCGGTSRARKRPLPQPLTSQCTSTRAQLSSPPPKKARDPPQNLPILPCCTCYAGLLQFPALSTQ